MYTVGRLRTDGNTVATITTDIPKPNTVLDEPVESLLDRRARNCYSRRCRNALLVSPNDTESYKLTHLGIVCFPRFLFGIVLLTTSAVVMSIIMILLPPSWLSHMRSRSEIKKTPPLSQQAIVGSYDDGVVSPTVTYFRYVPIISIELDNQVSMIDSHLGARPSSGVV